MPKISVIIPARNAQRYIEKCLLSLKDQTFKDFEVIVIDDSSLDSTAQIARKYAKVIKASKNLGEGAARNLGAKHAQANILAFTDADIVLPRDWLEKIIKSMKIHNVRCVGAGYCGSIGSSFIEKFAFLELIYRRKNIPKFVNTALSNNFACERDIFLECGGFPERYKCEDLRLSFTISRKYQILWDKENGVFHHFRHSLWGYLKQQFYFGRDTVWSYYEYPEIFFKLTHQGRLIYLEVILTFFSLVVLFLVPLAAGVSLLLIFLINFKFLLFLKKSGLAVFASLLVILLRNFICISSIFAGIGMCINDAASRFFGKLSP